jgi:hypothetical protein
VVAVPAALLGTQISGTAELIGLVVVVGALVGVRMQREAALSA